MNYEINQPRITSETIDDETIIIDFDTGTYYSLQGTASEIWRLIEENCAIDEIVKQFSGCYHGDAEEIDAAVRQFVGTLAQAELIVATAAPLAPRLSSQPATKTYFVPPLLEKHTDIQDLLLLDPIHEVSQRGWPMRSL